MNNPLPILFYYILLPLPQLSMSVLSLFECLNNKPRVWFHLSTEQLSHLYSCERLDYGLLIIILPLERREVCP